ncbi:MAG: calcium/sodium antiporter [Candidatus Woesearchaeota archaeon]
MEPLFALLVFIAGVFLLVKGADWLIKNAAAIGRYLRISPLIIGLTVVSIGTSLPEFFVAIFGMISGSADIPMGNIVGSNIANIGLVIGVAALVCPLVIKEKTLIYQFPFMLVSAMLLFILSNDSNIFNNSTYTIGRFDGAVFVVILLFFILYLYRTMRFQRTSSIVEKEFKGEFYERKRAIVRPVLLAITGMIALSIGGKLLVDSSSALALSFGVSEKFIGLTMVALGTSLPEFFATIMAAYRKKADIVIGNIVGSNILNVLFVVGITGLFRPFSVSPSLVHIDMVIMTALVFIFLTFATVKKSVERHEGGLLLAAYVGYIIYLFLAI